MTKIKSIGIDIGGVIIDSTSDMADTMFYGDHLQTPMVNGAFESIANIVEFYGDQIYIVSKCYSKVQAKTLEWLEHNNFYKITGIQRDNVHFCRQRKEKAVICEELKITDFVDDRLEILGYLYNSGLTSLYLFN